MWPEYISKLSSRLTDTETIANKFYPFYLAILREVFPPPQFTLHPQYPTAQFQPGTSNASDFVIAFVVESNDTPILFLEVKPPTYLASDSARKAAQDQILDRFGDIGHLVRVPILYGVSAIGGRLAYYSWEKETGLVKPSIKRDWNTRFVNTAPVNYWSTNIMEGKGYNKFMQMVVEVKDSVASLSEEVME